MSGENRAPSFESFSRKKPQFDDEFGSTEDFRKDPFAHVLGCDEPVNDANASGKSVDNLLKETEGDVRDSGIRENEEKGANANANANDAKRDESVQPIQPIDDPAVSFRSYTLADLEKQGKPISIRPTRYSIVAEAQKPATGTFAVLGEIAFAGGHLLHTMFAWLRGPGPRPKLADALRAPWVAFASEIRRGLKVLNWKKLTIGTAIGATTLLVCLFVVLAAADLTDDLKPARASGVQTTTASVKTIGQQTDPAVDPAAVVTPVVAAAPAAAADENTIEIDDGPAPAGGKKAPAARAAKPGVRLPAPPPRTAKGKVKSGDPFVP